MSYNPTSCPKKLSHMLTNFVTGCPVESRKVTPGLSPFGEAMRKKIAIQDNILEGKTDNRGEAVGLKRTISDPGSSNEDGPSRATPRSRLATRAEAQAYLGGICRRTFDRHVRPHLVVVSIGERVFFPWEELDQWVEVQKGFGSQKIPVTGSTRFGSGTGGRDSTSPRAREIRKMLGSSQPASTQKPSRATGAPPRESSEDRSTR